MKDLLWRFNELIRSAGQLLSHETQLGDRGPGASVDLAGNDQLDITASCFRKLGPLCLPGFFEDQFGDWVANSFGVWRLLQRLTTFGD